MSWKRPTNHGEIMSSDLYTSRNPALESLTPVRQ
ncbi:hypothetical protein [Paenibacillus sp. RU4X]